MMIRLLRCQKSANVVDGVDIDPHVNMTDVFEAVIADGLAHM